MKDVMHGPQSPVKESFGEHIDVDSAIQQAVYEHDKTTQRVHMFGVILFIIVLIVLVF